MSKWWTLEKLNALRSAYAEGVFLVKYTDREVRYRSLSEMKQIMNEAERDLGIKKKGPSRTVATFSKGLSRRCR